MRLAGWRTRSMVDRYGADIVARAFAAAAGSAGVISAGERADRPEAALAAGKAHAGRALDNPVLRTGGRVTAVDGILAVAVLTVSGSRYGRGKGTSLMCV